MRKKYSVYLFIISSCCIILGCSKKKQEYVVHIDDTDIRIETIDIRENSIHVKNDFTESHYNITNETYSDGSESAYFFDSEFGNPIIVNYFMIN